MTSRFDSTVTALRAVAHRFDTDAVTQQGQLLGALHKLALRETASLLTYYECLLFMRAHPANASMLNMVTAELRRLQTYLRKRRRHAEPLLNTGLPYTDTVMRFSHDCTRWLMQHPDCRVTLEEFTDATLDMNAVLRLTLPLLERPHTTAELVNDELCEVLGMTGSRTLPCLVAELSRFDDRPLVKDHLFDALGMYVRITPTNERFSTAGNQLPTRHTFYHEHPAPAFDRTGIDEQCLAQGADAHTRGARRRDRPLSEMRWRSPVGKPIRQRISIRRRCDCMTWSAVSRSPFWHDARPAVGTGVIRGVYGIQERHAGGLRRCVGAWPPIRIRDEHL